MCWCTYLDINLHSTHNPSLHRYSVCIPTHERPRPYTSYHRPSYNLVIKNDLIILVLMLVLRTLLVKSKGTNVYNYATYWKRRGKLTKMPTLSWIIHAVFRLGSSPFSNSNFTNRLIVNTSTNLFTNSIIYLYHYPF